MQKLSSRRTFVRNAAAGATMTLLGGGLYVFANDDEERLSLRREDGRARVPPGQRVLTKLKPMGGSPGDPRASRYRLKIHGEVRKPLSLALGELLHLPSAELSLDVHCVTGWSVLGARFKGVKMAELARLAGVKESASHVIFEAAHGYTANLPIEQALEPNALITWQLDGERLARAHGAPVRAVNPDRYFWKSPKWLTGIRFVSRDQPGYWEVRGYHNNADPWKEERHA